MKSIYGFWECDFCETRFTKEGNYKKHRCEMMVRDDFIRNTKRGRFAFMVYNHYMKTRGYVKQDRSVFRESKHYNSILKFVEFYYSAMLPDMPDYIDFVVNDINLLPQYWTRNDVYERYINEYDERVAPIRQAEITFRHMDTLARSLECEVHEILDHMYVSELVKFIQCKRFSPWVLIGSSMFVRYTNACSEEERPVIEAMVNPDVWLPRFRADLKTRKTIVELTKQFGI